MPSEWEKRGFDEINALKHSEKVGKPSLVFAVAIGLLMGFVTFFLFTFLSAAIGLIASTLLIIAIINISYIAIYPDVFKMLSVGELGFVLVDVCFFVAGFFLGLLSFTLFAH